MPKLIPTNDPVAWSARIDRKYRLSFEPQSFLPSGSPDWSASIILLRILNHDDLYKHPRCFVQITVMLPSWESFKSGIS